MRRLQDHETLGHRGLQDREQPCDGPAPVVADDRRAVATGVADHGGDVGDQVVEAVLRHPDRLVAQVVAAEIERRHLVMPGEDGDLLAPPVPEVGKAVDQDDEGAVAPRDVVDPHAAAVGVSIANHVRDVRRASEAGSEEHEEEETEPARHDRTPTTS